MLTTFLIEIFLLASVAGAEQSGCSREDARRIRSFLQNEVLPPLGLKPTDLPNSCALHPSLDMYGTHEAHKTSEHRSDWQCMYCRKRFVSENYLDRHLERFHSNLIPVSIDSIQQTLVIHAVFTTYRIFWIPHYTIDERHDLLGRLQ